VPARALRRGEDAVTVREFDIPRRSLWTGLCPSACEAAVCMGGRRHPPGGPRVGAGRPHGVRVSVHREAAQAGAKPRRRQGNLSRAGGRRRLRVDPIVIHDAAGNRVVLINRPLTTFESQEYLVTGDRVRQLMLPKKSEVRDLVAGS